MVPKLIIHPNPEIRLKEAHKILLEHNLKLEHPDSLIFNDEDKLGVEQSKKIREHLSLKPFQAKGRGVVLVSAQNLTPDAQNALLKTLEEPPEESVLLLGVNSEHDLLPTVLSRCQVVRIKNLESIHPFTGSESRIKEDKNFTADIKKLINSSVEERFEYIEKLEQKQEFLKALVIFYREQLPKNLEFIKELVHAEEWAEANGNIRGILEYLMLVLPESFND